MGQMDEIFAGMDSSIFGGADKVSAVENVLIEERARCPDPDGTVDSIGATAYKECGSRSFTSAYKDMGIEWAGIVAAMMAGDFITDACLAMDKLTENQKKILRKALTEETIFILRRGL